MGVINHKRMIMAFALWGSLFACSSPQSQERLDIILCWLRPSCLPHTLSTTPTSSQPNIPPTPFNLSASKCSTSTTITLTDSNRIVKVTYKEPTTDANLQALTNLDKTTIYLHTGKGMEKYKDIEATSPSGGGIIQETIRFSLKPEESLQATICVTATNTHGQEG